MLGIAVVVFVFFAFRVLPAGHRARFWAVVSLLFVIAEALIGAGLVRFEWVAANVSEARVYVVGFHLVNTFLLLGAMTLAAWHASGQEAKEIRLTSPHTVPLLVALLAVLAVGATGAVTALGDTLVLTEGIQPEDSPLVARLVASRFYHPTAALGAFALVLGVWLRLRSRIPPRAGAYGLAAVAVFGGQLLVGAINVFLKAPVPIQLVHLAVSDAIWILLLLMAAETLAATSHR